MQRKTLYTELARRSGVSKSTLYGWMNGVKVHNLDHLRRLASVLQISLYRLLFDENDLFCCGEEDSKLTRPEVLDEIFCGDVRISIQRIRR